MSAWPSRLSFFFMQANLAVQAVFLAGLFIITAANIGFVRALTPLKLIWPILVLTAVLTPPFNMTGRVLLTAGEHVILTGDGLTSSVSMVLRFTGITTAFFIYFSTTRTGDFILALRSFGLPYRAALTVTISLRYIPDMFKVYRNISDAHKLRSAGVRSSGRGFGKRLAHLYPVLISVLIHAVKSIPSLAMALDSKGFGRDNPRSSCQKLPPRREIAGHIAAAAVFTAGLALTVLFFRAG